MKIKIIRSYLNDADGAIDISEHIGKIFEVEDEEITFNNGTIGINFGDEYGSIAVYKEEYELVDVQKEVRDFISKYYKWGEGAEETIAFILENRKALVKILE